MEFSILDTSHLSFIIHRYLLHIQYLHLDFQNTVTSSSLCLSLTVKNQNNTAIEIPSFFVFFVTINYKKKASIIAKLQPSYSSTVKASSSAAAAAAAAAGAITKKQKIIMSNIIPFDPPRIFTARLKAGLVDVSTIAVDDDDDDADVDCSTTTTTTYHRGWDNATAATYYPSIRTNTNTTAAATSPTIPVPLERTETTSGKIMEITVNSSSSQPPVVVAFWLLRKLGHHPIVRLGYKLRLSSKNNNDDDEKGDDQNQNLRWELDTDELGRLTLLRIHIFHCSILNDDEIMMPEENNTQDDDNDAGVVVNSSLNELSALQLIAKQTQQQSSSSSCSIFPQKTKAHVVGTELIATTTTASDEGNNNIYAVLPYYRDGTLLQFCQSVGSPLDESLARYIFRQIIQVRKKKKRKKGMLLLLLSFFYLAASQLNKYLSLFFSLLIFIYRTT
jgi:hypothetical protein